MDEKHSEPKKQKKDRRAYLNDFRPDVNGNYVYDGDIYSYAGEGRPFSALLRELILLAVGMTAATVLCGCIPAAGMDNYFYVILPAVISIVACGSVCWAVVRLALNGSRLRAYVYEATVLKLPMRTGVVTVGSAAAAAGELLFLLLHGFVDKVPGTAAFLLLQIAAVLLSVRTRKTILQSNWEK